jgi:uncharacterized protein DUF3558
MTKRRRFWLLSAVVAVAVVGTVVVVVANDHSDRPRELALTAVPPCELISTSDYERLGVALRPSPGLELAPGEEGTGCRFLPHNGATVDLMEITEVDLGWADGTEDFPRINGFPVVRAWTTSEEDSSYDPCRLYVDVADDEALKVYVKGVDAKKSDISSCDVAYQFAEAAMRTLIQFGGSG